MGNKKETEAFSAYVAEEESKGMVSEEPVIERKEATVTPVYERSDAPYNPSNGYERIQAVREMNAGSDVHYRENMGYLKVSVESLPSQGLFYPSGVEISIRAARGEEIKHWSTMNDEDISQLSRTDDILNYMIERCCLVRFPGKPGNAWQDLKSVDRFYLLLAIKEFTFIKGENQLMVPYGEGKEIPVTKEMIDFITIPDDIRDYYSPEEKCFIFNINGNVIKMYIPSLGVNAWLKNYAINKSNNREPFDQDFLNFAPMLIKDHRNLSQKAYEDFVSETQIWGVDEWSVVSYVTNTLSDATEPKLKFVDEGGDEKEVPLSFRGGIRAIFVISNPLRSICRS